MKKAGIIFILLISVFPLLKSQSEQAVVTYERRVFWINIMSKMPWITQEDIDRDKLTWGKQEGKYAEKYDLIYKDGMSVYTYQQTDDNYGYSWQKDNYLLIRNHQENTSKDHLTSLGKNFVVEGETPKIKWKILNEIKEIQGYLCMKAETIDPVRNVPVYAWFTNKIRIPSGPEGYGGLPGLILGLEFNKDDVLIEATKIDLEKEDLSLPIPKKMKGKDIALADYQTKLKDFIEESMEGKRNPFWRIRY